MPTEQRGWPQNHHILGPASPDIAILAGSAGLREVPGAPVEVNMASHFSLAKTMISELLRTYMMHDFYD